MVPVRKRSWSVWLLFLASFALPYTVSASISFSATATGVGGASDTLSAFATMLLPGETDAFGHACTGVVGTLCITLQNTQVGGTTSRADVLASLYFSVIGSPTLSAASAWADTVVNSDGSITPNVNALSVSPQSPVLNGGWALATKPGTDTVNTSLPTTGYAWTTVGNNGAFSNGTYNVGNDDYALISGTNAKKIGGNIPVISNEIFLTLTGFQSGGSSLALSSINGVVFSWNSTGVYSGVGIPTVPESGTAGMLGVGLLGVGVVAKMLHRRRARPSTSVADTV